MVDLATKLVSELKTATGLPVHYELFCDSSTAKPCITYKVNNNRQTAHNDILGYDDISYYVKVWGNIEDNVFQYTDTVESTMRDLGFTRQGYQELVVETQICLVFLYGGLAQQYFSEV